MKPPKDKERGLSLERVRDVLGFDPETGYFVWKKRTAQKIKIDQIAGQVRNDGYIVISLDNNIYLAHRLAWFHYFGCWPQDGIDHIDGNPSNNRISNLRNATSSQNHGNMKMFSTNTSGVRGVSLHRTGKWIAEVWHQRRKIYLGLFDSKEAAGAVCRAERLKRFGKFARVE